MAVIYKYELSLVEIQYINIPVGFKPLKVDFQKDKLCLWALVNLSSPPKPCEFQIIGTGWIREDGEFADLIHIGTVYKNNFVWHVFYRKQR